MSPNQAVSVSQNILTVYSPFSRWVPMPTGIHAMA